MGKVIRSTASLAAVLETFLANPGEELWGFRIGEEAGVYSGTLYPLLARLEKAGMIVGRWEDIDESAEGRRKRRYFHLTGAGREWAQEVLANRPVLKGRHSPGVVLP